MKFRSILFALAMLLLCTGGAFFFFKPQPWYPRLRNLFFPPELVTATLPDGVRYDKFVLEKSERLLLAYSNGRPIKAYIVALSKNPTGHKQYEGDKKVPEGTYHIYDKNPFSRYYKNVGVSYPNEQDRAVAESLGKAPGGEIKIHGLGPKERKRGQYHWLKDWSAGCIVVTDEEIDEIYARTPVGIPIEIHP